MLSAFQGKWVERLASGILILVVLMAALRLLTGAGSGVVNAVVYSDPPERLDRTVYRFDGSSYTRIGHVVDTDGVRHRMQIVPDEGERIEDYVAVQVPVTLSQYLRMVPEGDIDQLINKAMEAVSVAADFTVSYFQEDPGGLALRSTFLEVWKETLEKPELQDSRAIISAQLSDEVSPAVLRQLRKILLARIEHALDVIYADATENYGLDLVGGEFNLKPLNDAFDGFLADPRVLETASNALTGLAEDPQVTAAAQAIAIDYVDALQRRLMTVELSVRRTDPNELRASLNTFFSGVESYIYRDGEANPVILSIARNLISGDAPWANAIVILMEPGIAASRFSTDSLLPLTFGWEATR